MFIVPEREIAGLISAEAGVPPYVIFHDATLRELAERRGLLRRVDQPVF